MAESIYKYIFFNKFKKKRLPKVFCRSSSIPKTFIKRAALFYKGNLYFRITFTRHHVNYKSGEFGVTRKPFKFPRKKKKIKR